MVSMRDWWIEDNGTCLRITKRGLLIGRSNQCDIGVQDPRVSRRHLIVRLDGDGPVLELVGRNWARVNGKAVRPRHAHPLAAGDRITMPGRMLWIVPAKGAAVPASRAGWSLHYGDGLYGINHVPFVVGGSAADDLVVPAWPASALCVLSAGDMLTAEARYEVRLAGGRRFDRSDILSLTHGDELVLAGERLRVLWRARPSQTVTVEARRSDAPLAARLQRLPGSGGRLVLSFPEGEVEAVLAVRRFDCVHGLLCPPDGHQPGDWISDHTLARAVWPRDGARGGVDIDVLLAGVYKELAKHGIDGQALIQRANHSTRFALAPGANVLVGKVAC